MFVFNVCPIQSLLTYKMFSLGEKKKLKIRISRLEKVIVKNGVSFKTNNWIFCLQLSFSAYRCLLDAFPTVNQKSTVSKKLQLKVEKLKSNETPKNNCKQKTASSGQK